ncbi:Uncharacterised protein [Actinobacillus pleuropneumoniae]|nr:Uncharacterised protein [Actinobacillus pleuropneumoniae]
MLLSQIEELFMVIKDYLRSFVTKIGVRHTEDQALPKGSSSVVVIKRHKLRSLK